MGSWDQARGTCIGTSSCRAGRGSGLPYGQAGRSGRWDGAERKRAVQEFAGGPVGAGSGPTQKERKWAAGLVLDWAACAGLGWVFGLGLPFLFLLLL